MAALATHDEREQTLNQLLVEMDGFDPGQGVVIMAATNRPEVLDPALVRPGRFDRQVLVDRPDIHGRREILAVHAKRIVLAPYVDLQIIAQRTPGMVGADLANVVNEAALASARRGAAQVEQQDFEEAIDRIQLGLKKRSRVMNEAERRRVAYHESGHALVALSVSDADPVHRVTIVPRSIGALGATLQLPTEDRYLMTRDELLDRICVMLGGRAAEQVIFGSVSTGAHWEPDSWTRRSSSASAEISARPRPGPSTRRSAPCSTPRSSARWPSSSAARARSRPSPAGCSWTRRWRRTSSTGSPARTRRPHARPTRDRRALAFGAPRTRIPRDMDLNELYVFARIVEAGSLPAAARILGLPPSTLSRKVAQLEERLGVQLLHRTAQTLELTGAGTAYYQRCARMTTEVEDAEREALSTELEPRGRLRVSAPCELTFLGDVAAAFLAHHPHVELDLELTARTADPGDDVDLALCFDRPAEPGLAMRRLGAMPRVFCATPAYLHAHGTPRAVADLAAHRCIVVGSPWRPAVARLLGPDGHEDVSLPARLVTGSLYAAHRAALAGAGLALLPRSACAHDLAAGHLHAVLHDAVPPAEVLAIYPDLRQLPTRVRAFLDILDQHRHLSPWAGAPHGQ